MNRTNLSIKLKWDKEFMSRKKCKLSQMQLGELIGITKNSVSNIELGKQMCSSVNLECMARILGTTSIFLLYGKETIDSKNGNSSFEEEMLIDQENEYFRAKKIFGSNKGI